MKTLTKVTILAVTSVTCFAAGLATAQRGTVKPKKNEKQEVAKSKDHAKVQQTLDSKKSVSQEEVLKELRDFTTNYPESPAAPFALRSIGDLLAKDDRLGAVRAYYELCTKYPDSPEVGKAGFAGFGRAHEFKMWDVSAQFVRVALKHETSPANRDNLEGHLKILEEHIKKHGPGNAIDYTPTRYDRISQIANRLKGAGASRNVSKSGFHGKLMADEYIRDFPNDEYIPDALFLGGLIDYFSLPDVSAESFAIIVEKYPDHHRSHRARLYLPTLYEMMGQWEEAADAWQEVVTRYADSADIDEFRNRYKIAKARADFSVGKKLPLTELLTK
ncbi:tol-pal system YbgF family protein [Candidatus Hydrogenedentota bacterium]